MANEAKSIKDNIITEADAFYKEALEFLTKSGVPYLVGGGFALKLYTNITRDTKDLDIFCKASDCPRLLKFMADNGYNTELVDARWLAKAKKGDRLVDLIFDNPSSHCPVDDSWFERAEKGTMFELEVQFVAAEELIRSKLYVQNRERYDGSDINHLILRYGKNLDWKRIMLYMEQHWQLLLAQILSFQFVYPSERDLIPRWLFDGLLQRAKENYDMPAPTEKICRGPLIDQTQYGIDITDWDFKVVTMRTV